MKSGISRSALFGISVAFGMMTMLPAASLAESQCKGLEKNACERKADCSWVEGYKRKDGKKVSSYCRSASKKSTSNSTPKKKDVKKTEDKKKDEKK